MGFFSSSCTFTRFRILDPVNNDLWGEIPQRLKQFAFRDIDDIPEERSFGWTNFEDMLDTEWLSAPPEKADYYFFSLRLDTRRIPAAVIKKYLTIAMKEEKAKLAEKNLKFISRERKKELKEQVLLKLRMRFLPTPAVFNVLWSVKTGHVWFASAQTKMIELFTEYFLRSFDLHLEQLSPYNLAVSMLGEDSVPQLESLHSTIFSPELLDE